METTRRRDRLRPAAIQAVRDRVAAALPAHLVRRIQALKAAPRIRSARRALEAAQPVEERLPLSELRRMHGEYAPSPAYSYESDVRSDRGRARAEAFLTMVPDSVHSILETGCFDGMVGYHLARHGKDAAGIDFRPRGFDQRAIDAGVRLLGMDAEALEFEDDSFDAVISYDSFEHFGNPERALSEIQRVVRPGGYVYLEFGPLFLSPMGLHAPQITVPYCQVLFSNETLTQFTEEAELKTIDFAHCNEWTLLQFRELFASFADRFETVSYSEDGEFNHLELIERYAPIFRGRSDQLEDFTCAAIRVLLRNR